MMWWGILCAVVVAGSAVVAAPASESLAPIDLVQMDSPASDDESLGYAVPPMGGRYAAGAPWLYFLAELPRDSQVAMRARRSFSVNPAVELLQRGAYQNYMERVAQDNRDFLNRVGKRVHWRRPVAN